MTAIATEPGRQALTVDVVAVDAPAHAPSPVVTLPALMGPALMGPALMGTGLPGPIRTVGALALLLLAVAVTGIVLVAVAVAMPVLLVVALVLGRQPRGERAGWREAAA